jgi:ABC-type lipoprotein export system ATPase subunit
MDAIRTITVLGGQGKSGELEPVNMVEFTMGDVVSIVGPTGSGKTTLLNDIMLYADKTTPSQRRVLINGATPPPEYSDDSSCNPIAAIYQGTAFHSNELVGFFLALHAEVRHHAGENVARLVEHTIDFANQLTGEPVSLEGQTTELSGGQTRALLIADAAIIGNAPIVLLDEIENAGIDRAKAVELLRQSRDKIYLFVTHDPTIALQSDFRIVMKGGMMVKVIRTSDVELGLSSGPLRRMDEALSAVRNKIRMGESLLPDALKGIV